MLIGILFSLNFWMIESVPCHECMVGLYLIMIMLSRTFVLILLKCLYKVPIATSQWASLNFSFSFQVLPFVNGQVLTSLSFQLLRFVFWQYSSVKDNLKEAVETFLLPTKFCKPLFLIFGTDAWRNVFTCRLSGQESGHNTQQLLLLMRCMNAWKKHWMIMKLLSVAGQNTLLFWRTYVGLPISSPVSI